MSKSDPRLHTPSPIRRFPDNGNGSPEYSAWSPKLQRVVGFDRQYQFSHWLLIEGDPAAEQFCEYYPEANFATWTHVFDMWVRWADGSEQCIDVVPAWKLVLTEGFMGRLPPDWPELESWGRRHGYKCSFVTELDLSVFAMRMRNWRRLLPFVDYARESPDEMLEQAVMTQVGLNHGISLRDLRQALPNAAPTHVRAIVANLLHRGRIAADLDKESFGPNLVLRPNGKAGGGNGGLAEATGMAIS